MTTTTIKYKPLYGYGRLWINENEGNDASLEDYVSLCNEALNLKKPDFEKANLASQKAALHYGSPGLVLYFKTKYATLVQEKDDGEIIEIEGSNLLSFLLLAEKLAAYEPDAEALIKKNFPEYCDTKGAINWKKMKNNLIVLANLKGWTADPEETAEIVYKQCINNKK